VRSKQEAEKLVVRAVFFDPRLEQAETSPSVPLSDIWAIDFVIRSKDDD
jgi:hypothetical protein